MSGAETQQVSTPAGGGSGGSMGYVYLLTTVAALGGLLFGYDTAVIAGAIGFLQKRFALDAVMTGWAVSAVLVGCMAGVALTGGLSDRLGRKKVLLLAAVLFTVSAVGAALATSLRELVVARILGGFAVGAASIASPLYIAEVAPARIRGQLVSLNQIAIIAGMLVVSIVNWLIASPDNEAWNVAAGWRWMFASGGVPALFFLLALFLVPESPRWLTKQGRESEAMVVLTRVGGHTKATAQMIEIKDAITQERPSIPVSWQWPAFGLVAGGLLWLRWFVQRSHAAGALRPLSLAELSVAVLVILICAWLGRLLGKTFHLTVKADFRWAGRIAVVLAILQQVTGINAVLYYAPAIFKSSGAGVTATQALLQTAVLQVVNLAFTLVAIWVVDRAGRKPLLLATSAAMGISLVLLGGAFWLQLPPVWIFAFTLAYVASFAVAMGPVVWVVLAEIFPTRTRGEAMGVATLWLWLACFAVSQTVPWMFQKLREPVTFWTYAAMCVVSLGFVAAFVPETKGKSLEEIERSWRE